MSVVIAIKEKNKIILGCDSQVTCGYIKSILPNNHSKIFDIKNCKHGLMGIVGSVRDCQLLSIQNNLIQELPLLKGEINFDYVVRNLYNDIYKILLDNNRILKDEHGHFLTSTENDYIFAYKDKAYLINGGDGSVEEIEDYLVIGSGYEIAMGVLENNKGKIAEARIIEAIKACSERTIYVDDNVFIKKT